MTPQHIAEAIDKSPLNRGISGADWLASKGNIPIELSNGDIALFDDEGDGVYEGHYFFTSRGKEAVASARDILRLMFTQHDARVIFGMVPAGRREVGFITRRIGFKFIGPRHTPEGWCDLFVLPRTRYFRSIA